MSLRKTLPLILASAAISTAPGADPIFTAPVGFVKLGNTAGGMAPAVAANSDTRLTIPLEQSVEFTGTVDLSTSNTVKVTGSPGWTTDQWTPGTGEPFGVIIKSGAEDGLRALITAHTADTLTVSVTSPGDLTNLVSGDSISIRKCWTLQNLVAGQVIPDGTQLLLWSETLSDINQISTDSYVFGGGNWYNNVGFSDGNNVILHPGESFVLRTPPGTSIANLTLFGDVPDSALRNILHKDGPTGAEDLHIASMLPVPSLVADLAIPVKDGDQLFVYDPAGTGINQPASDSYVFGGGSWYNNIGFANVTATLTMEPGLGYIVRRAASSPTTEEWTEPAP
ncbi:TIGR02597 family protein [Haloferula sp.]|uniref:TIGR02597 family protein n=1 Tax=Haloferula sp. TaxID=2497595 RepID=UPI00329ED948